MRGLLFNSAIVVLFAAAAAPVAASPTPVDTNATAVAATPSADARIAEAEKRAADLDRRNQVLEARSEIEGASHSRLEIIGGWLGAVIGLFGALITVVIVFFAFKTKEIAVLEAKKEIAAERENIARMAADAAVKLVEIEGVRTRVVEISENVEATAAAAMSGAPATPEALAELKQVSEAIEDKPVRGLTEAEFRVRIGDLAARGENKHVLDLAVAMRQLFTDNNSQAFALFAEGWALGVLTRGEEAIAAYDDLVARFGNSSEPALRDQVARALVNKGVRLKNLGKPAEAVVIYDDVLSRFGDAVDPVLREAVARALINKGNSLRLLGKFEDEIAAYDDLLERFGDSAEPTLRERVAKALFYKACASARTGDVAATVDILRRWRDHSRNFDCKAVANDKDFDSIRDHPDFIAFLKEMGCPPKARPRTTKRKPKPAPE
jgi:tetratricopeptide (TPR) repeat protein